MTCHQRVRISLKTVCHMSYLISTAINALSQLKPCSAFSHNTGHAEGTEMTARTPQLDKGMVLVYEGRLGLFLIYLLYFGLLYF